MAFVRISLIAWLVIALPAFVAADEPVDYAAQIKPLLSRSCVSCHGPKKQQAGLRVDTVRGMIIGGDSGTALVPREPAKSLLIQALTGTEGTSKMPQEGPEFTVAEIELVRRWIYEGATAPTDEVAETAVMARSNHWSFQPIRPGIAPDVDQPKASRNPIDNFILHRLRQEMLTASEEADRATLIRRAHLDLIGIPPTVEAVQEFLSDTAPDAYERMIDRLLASPHYGERWSRDWLDAARYADSNGFTRDQPRSIWKYRDWVINALNEDRPFDQFVIDQIAGDLLPQPSLDQLVATGFHRNTLINEEGGTDPEQFRVEAVVDRVNTTGTVFLGLTIGCAQCHDHKYDPITQREYYQLFAYYNSTEFHPGDPAAPRIDVPSIEQQAHGEPAKQQEIRKQIATLKKELDAQQDQIAQDLVQWETTLTEQQKKELPFNVKNAVDLPVSDRSEVHKRDLDEYFRGLPVAREKYPQLEEISRLKQAEPKFPSTMITREAREPRNSFIHIRGDFTRKGAAVEPTIPAALKSGDLDKKQNRLTLALWLVSPDNPLTARVTVNRYWQRFFGRGLVETENDFGTQGARPTHPELLDWLADEFRGASRKPPGTSGDGELPQRPAWGIKRFHRLVTTSATYRQSSRSRQDLVEQDPLNKLLARQSRIRVDAEVIRDSALAVSGLMTEELGGPPVYPPQPEGVFDFTQDKKTWKTSTGRDRYRKAMYIHLWRSSLYPSMSTFDFPDPNVTCTRRIRSNTPLQSLTLANDEAFFELAAGFGVKLRETPASDDSQRLNFAVLAALSREPTSAELARLRAYLNQQRQRFEADYAAVRAICKTPATEKVSAAETAAWVMVARVLMNLDEFITRE